MELGWDNNKQAEIMNVVGETRRGDTYDTRDVSEYGQGKGGVKIEKSTSFEF